jgi:hypothetical protein
MKKILFSLLIALLAFSSDSWASPLMIFKGAGRTSPDVKRAPVVAVSAGQDVQRAPVVDQDVKQAAAAQQDVDENKLKNACEKHEGQPVFGGTYLWVKKPGEEYFDQYSQIGIAKKDDAGKYRSAKLDTTTDLDNAFCMVKIDLQVSDSLLSDALRDGRVGAYEMQSESRAFFALGDTISCGSWLSKVDIEGVSKYINRDKVQEWLDTIGSKIQCKVGNKVVGSYSDVIELK